MEITINLFWIVLLIIVVHTILQHLINWGWRRIYEDEDEDNASIVALIFFVTAIEAVLVVAFCGYLFF